MADLNNLEDKAWDLARASLGVDDLLKAVQAARQIKEIREDKKPPSWAGAVVPLCGVFAVALTALTLTYQVKQWNVTVTEQRNATEDQQWTDVMKQISLKDPSAVQVGAFGLASFFDSKRHAVQAREIASAILPFTDNNTGFEVVWKGLVKHTTNDNQRDLLVVARQVSYNERDLFDGMKSRSVPQGCPVAEIADFLSSADKCYPFHQGVETPEAKRAWLYSWQIDSTTDALAKIWHDKDKGISPAGLRLSGIILTNAYSDKVNFRNLDFSQSWLDGSVIHLCDIAGANFKGATMNGADLHQVTDFKESKWEGANWWDSDSISPCELVDYLNKNYPPAASSSKERASRLYTDCESHGAHKP